MDLKIIASNGDVYNTKINKKYKKCFSGSQLNLKVKTDNLVETLFILPKKNADCIINKNKFLNEIIMYKNDIAISSGNIIHILKSDVKLKLLHSILLNK